MTSVCRCLFVVPLLVLALSALGTASLYGAASEPPPTIPYGNRTDVFRRLLFELRFQPLLDFGQLDVRPSESLIIVLGKPDCLDEDYRLSRLPLLVERGAAVLIATDMETEGRAGEKLSKLAGVTVTGETLVCPGANPMELYNASPYCPFVQPTDSSTLKITPNLLSMLTDYVSVADRPALFRDPHSNRSSLRVVTNAPSRLKLSGRSQPEGIHRLARLPRTCQDEKDKEPAFVDGKGPLFAVGGTVGKGRVLVLADHSIFINRMILPRNNDNLEFAVRCLHWLRGGASSPMEALAAVNNPIGQRNKVLFWDDGVIRSDFEVPLKRMPIPPVPALPPEPVLVAALDNTLAKLEHDNSFNRALLERIDNLPGRRERVVRNTVYLLTFAALMFLVYRFLWRSRHRPELAIPPLANALREHEPRGSLLDQRRRALLRMGNLWEMGHRLARECFESAGVALTSASLPRVRVMQGGLWQRWRVQRRMIRLWRLARGDAQEPISPTALQYLRRELEQLKIALADGTIQLT